MSLASSSSHVLNLSKAAKASDQRKQTGRFKIKTIFKHEKGLYDLMNMAAGLKIMIPDLF